MKDYHHRRGDDGLPLIEDCVKGSFEDYYTAPEVASAFAAFYNNENGIFDKFLNFWDVVSTRFANNDFVIGYDFFNEPWPANLYYDISLLLEPTKFDRTVLYPMTVKATNFLLDRAPNKLVFFEPAQFPDNLPFFGGIVYNIGFPQLPGGQDRADVQVLNDHTYCCQAAKWMCDEGDPYLSEKEMCRDFHFQRIRTRTEDAQRMHVPLLISEFGACSNSEACFAEITNACDAMDESLANWAHW